LDRDALVGKNNNLIFGEKYEIITPDDTKATGTLKQDDFVRLEKFSAGVCMVSSP
jgi:hypothetical protein